MKKLMLLVSMLFVVGCKGPMGSKGDKGDTGLHGPGQISVISGAVTSDDFNVTDARIGIASNVCVYIAVGGEVIQLPIWNPTGFNVMYVGKSPSDRKSVV